MTTDNTQHGVNDIEIITTRYYTNLFRASAEKWLDYNILPTCNK